MTKILIPAAFTLANLACGVLAIRLAVCSHPEDAAQTLLQCGWLLIAAMVFDALDGPVARRLGVTSRIGAVLDGIADGVSFGIVPAAVLLLIWSQPSEEHLSALSPALVTIAAIYALVTVTRLVRFVGGEFSSKERRPGFTGLPSPAAASLLVGGLLALSGSTSTDSALHRQVLPVSALIIAGLMVAPVRYAKPWSLIRESDRYFLAVVLLVSVGMGVRLGAFGAVASLAIAYATSPAWRALGRRDTPEANVSAGGTV